jgi:hypothetical protein
LKRSPAGKGVLVTEHETEQPGPELDDPRLEARRAAEAAERERESRSSDRTKYDELRELEVERSAERAERVADVPDEVEG